MKDDMISRREALDALNEQIEQCDKALSSFDISMKDEYAVKVERASLVAFGKTLKDMPSAQPELVEKVAYIRGFEQGRTQGMIDAKAGEVAQPNLQPTCNQLATDTISRRAAINAVTDELDMIDHVPQWVFDRLEKRLKQLSSAQPEIIHCKECKYSERSYRNRRRCFLWSEDEVSVFDDGYCNYAERKTNG